MTDDIEHPLKPETLIAQAAGYRRLQHFLREASPLDDGKMELVRAMRKHLLQVDQDVIQEREDAWRWYMNRLRETGEMGPNLEIGAFIEHSIKEYRAHKAQGEAVARVVDENIIKLYAQENESTFTPHNPDAYPHICPRCDAPAYIGALTIECSRNCPEAP